MAGSSVNTVSPAQAGPSGQLAPESTLAGGRYEIVRLEGHGAFGEIYRATDQQSKKLVSLRLIPPELVTDAATLATLTKEIGLVAHMEHKNVCKTHGVAQDGAHTFLVADVVDGQSVRDLIERKKTAGTAPFSLKGAYNIVAHICNALSYAHRQTFHGVLCSRNVFVNKAGRIKIAEFGVARALPGVLSIAAQQLGDPTLFASDLANGNGDLRCDVYSVGAILYELVTGQTPGPNPTAPSQMIAGLDPQVDRIIATCMASTAVKRPRDIGQLKTALKKAVDSPGQPTTTGRVSAVQPAQSSQQPAVAAGAAMGVNEHAEKWLIQKDKMDYGPFSLNEVKKQIASNQFVMGNVIMDNDSGQRCKLEKHPLLRELVLEAHQRREERRRAQAEVSAVTQSRKRGAALYVFIAVAVLGLVGGGYFAVTALGSAKKDTGGGIGSLGEAELAVTIKFTPQSKGSRSGRRGSKGRRRGSKGSKGGWDDSLDLGNASKGGGSERLSNGQLNSVISTRGGALGRCLQKSGERSVNVEFIVKGTGKVAYVRVNGKTDSRAANCIRGVMKKMNFPSFNGPRTKGDFNMSL